MTTCLKVEIKNGGIFTCSLRAGHLEVCNHGRHIESEITVSATFPPGSIREDIVKWIKLAPPIVRVMEK